MSACKMVFEVCQRYRGQFFSGRTKDNLIVLEREMRQRGATCTTTSIQLYYYQWKKANAHQEVERVTKVMSLENAAMKPHDIRLGIDEKVEDFILSSYKTDSERIEAFVKLMEETGQHNMAEHGRIVLKRLEKYGQYFRRAA